MTIRWDGILPAITTPFTESGGVDYSFLVSHAEWMLDAGCHGIVPLGSLGEGATLTPEEKREILRELVRAFPNQPIVPGISALGTDEAVALARDAEQIGCAGLMVLPPYVYSTDWREMGAHMRAIIEATSLPCLLYNNPVAYKTDFVPEQIAELASYENVVAVKESSADARRIQGIRALIGDRLNLMVGVDDIYVEAARNGAKGWIAGLVNAFPHETVSLWKWAGDPAKTADCDALYHWFLPLLRLDTVPKFVQLIKLTQQCVGKGSERVRAPRLELVGDERKAALSVIETALATRVVSV
ncbi:MAG: dihydrodipicolinate synthase family protein [Fimbriimonadaceae bacterium]|nr:dihydrodipicolinate synthase family protein [Fimbriimonadaceae bacterium]